MRITRTRLIRGLFAAAATGAAAVSLLACLGDFNVLPPETDAASKVDSATPPIDGTTPPGDGGFDARDDGDAGPRPTRCDGVATPVGVNPGDFLCADFDSPVLSKAWDSVIRTDGGVIEKTSDVAVSQPSAMSTTASGFGQATLLWRKGGAQRFTEATAVFQINPSVLAGVAPPATGTLELMHITTSNASVTFGYSRGSNDFGGPPGYYGYYVNVAAFGGAAAIQRFKITGAPLDPNVWTEVTVTWEAAGGSVIVLYNKTKIFSETGFSSLDTSVSFRLGAYAAGNVGVMPLHRFDDVALSIRR